MPITNNLVVSLYRQKRNLHMASETIRSRAKENRNVTCMLVTVVVIFYAVWFPFHVESFIYYFRPDVKVPCYFYWIGYYVLPFLHPVINPVVFCIFSETYYQSFKQLLFCPWLCNSNCKDPARVLVSHCGVNNVPNDVQEDKPDENIELQKLQSENNDPNSGQVNKVIENTELQEQC